MGNLVPLVPEDPPEGPNLLERTVEKKLVERTQERGGKAYKFVSPGTDGMPDRLILLPGGLICFVELKAPGQKPRPLQVRRHQQLRDLGAMVRTIDHPDQINQVLNEIQTT